MLYFSRLLALGLFCLSAEISAPLYAQEEPAPSEEPEKKPKENPEEPRDETNDDKPDEKEPKGDGADQEDKPSDTEAENTEGQKSAKNGKDAGDDGKSETKDKAPSRFETLTKEMDRTDGLFQFYTHPKKGSVKLAISPDQLGTEYIYHQQISDGIAAAGPTRGAYRSEKIFVIRRSLDFLHFVQINPYFYYHPESPLARAKNANVSDSIFAALKIEAEDEETGALLVNPDQLFRGELFERLRMPIVPSPLAFLNFGLGKISKSKSRITDIKSFPENASVAVDYVFDNPGVIANAGPEAVDPRFVKIGVVHSLLAMPDDQFKPRFDDQRVGYFLSYQDDQTSLSDTPYRDKINRWRLIKEDPNAELSEPVEPITWWIENTTPYEIRGTIKDAVEAWNIAFEAAGFKNAIIAKIQPDDADWDASDVRYNVLRWVSSPTRQYTGYGPSFANPRTGEILGADIMLEYGFFSNRLRQGQIFDVFDGQSLNALRDNPIALLEKSSAKTAKLMQNFRHDHARGSLGAVMHHNNMLGQTLQRAHGLGADAEKELIKQSIYFLVLHEVGHTLGLNHNMRGSQARSYETVYNKAAQEADGLAGSVMDYPAINIAPKTETQAYYYNTKPGPYDIWAIQFGYDDRLSDKAAREAHLARSLDPKLAFGNDADTMFAPGLGLDPRVNVNDMSDNAIQFALDRLEMDRSALENLPENFVKTGKSYQALRNAYAVILGDMFNQASTISRFIGGVHVDRMVAGQTTPDGREIDPYRPVEEAQQRFAMQALADNIFAPDAFDASPALLRKLALQRRGFNQFFGADELRIHDRVFSIQLFTLFHLLHPATQGRLIDSGLYGNTYSLTEMMEDLTLAVFSADSRGSVNTFRQDLQIVYVQFLTGMMNSGFYIPASRSVALANLREIRRTAERSRARGDGASRAHRDHLVLLIDKALQTYAS